MNCFSEDFIQAFIDDECTEQEKALALKHMAGCTNCKQKVESHKELALRFKTSINELVPGIPEMPEIAVFHNQEKPSIPLRKKWVYTMAAACILLLLTLMVGKQENNEHNDLYLYQEVDFEVDANKPIAEQELIMYVIDENGKISNKVY